MSTLYAFLLVVFFCVVVMLVLVFFQFLYHRGRDDD